MAAALAVLSRAYGALTLTEAWNAYLPILGWLAFLLAVWSVLEGDLAMLPVAVFAACFCVQSHIAYPGPVGGLAAMAAVSTLRCLRRRKGVNGARRGAVRWVLMAVGVGALLWVPPLLEEASNRPGNLAKLVDYFGDPGATTLGLREGVELRLVHLDLWRLAAGDVLSCRSLVTGSVLPGAVLLLAWAGAVVIAWRLCHATLLRLHLVLAATLALNAVSMGRIIGEAWYYQSRPWPRGPAGTRSVSS